MASRTSFSYKDYDSEVSSVGFDVTTLTAANFDATISAINTLSAAILGVQTENCLQSKTVTAQSTFISRAKAATKPAQREHKWIVTLEDATTHRLTTHEIPIADVALVGTDVDTLDLSAGVGGTLKDAIEAVVKFPGTGNGVNVMSIVYSGARA